MGWTVLYVGFGFVALWLLGEVLLQYKARLRWRMLAFTGFLGVVAGVLLHSVPVIVAGALAFAVGQTYVTLSFRRGFSTGWAIGGSPGESRRRKGAGERAATEPALEVSDLEYGSGAPGEETPTGDVLSGAGAEASEGYAQQGGYDQPAYSQDGYQPNGFDANGYGSNANDPNAYDPSTYDPSTYDPNAYERPGYDPVGVMAPDSTAVYAPQPMPDDTGQYGIYSDTAYGTAAQYGAYDTTGYDQNQQQSSGQYDYGNGQQQYAPYSDPYVGSGQYDASYGGRQQYTDPYAGQYTTDTPPGGVWVPQQRETEQPPYGTPEQPAQQSQPNDSAHVYDNGGYSEQQYRY